MQEPVSRPVEPPSPATHFASAERAAPEALRRAVAAVNRNPLVAALLDTFGGMILVLNTQRQIVAANTQALRLAGYPSADDALGLRPGEALHCVHAFENPLGGCGTGPFCGTCGAVIAVLASQAAHETAERECLLTVKVCERQEAFEFRVKATPLTIEGEDLTIVSLQDIREEKRKEALEAIFLHDIMNSALSLHSASRLLARCPADRRDHYIEAVTHLSKRLMMEITEQREMLDLEAGRFQVRKELLAVREVFDLVRQFFAEHDLARGRTLTFLDACGDDVVYTDSVLVRRVLVNMVKNSLEATPEGGEVRAWCEAGPECLVFKVWNARAMPPQVALRVFQRYFSTKGQPGRGLGTYSMKLIGERYLRGSVSFTTSEADGTTFRLDLPREAPAATA